MPEEVTTEAAPTTADWMAGLTQEVRDHAARSGLDSPGKALESHYQLSKYNDGTQRVPKQDDGSDKWASFYQSLGAPQAMDGYALPESTTANHQMRSSLEAMRETALSAGLTTTQWDSITSKAIENSTAEQTRFDEAVLKLSENAKLRLQEKYGADSDSKIATAQRAFEQIIGDNPELKQILDLTGLTNYLGFIEMFAKAGDVLGSAEIPGSPQDLPAGGHSHSFAEALKWSERSIEIQQMFRAGKTKRGPEHDRLVAEVMELGKKLTAAGYKGAMDTRLSQAIDLSEYGGRF